VTSAILLALFRPEFGPHMDIFFDFIPRLQMIYLRDLNGRCSQVRIILTLPWHTAIVGTRKVSVVAQESRSIQCTGSWGLDTCWR
jgi:hypothetical protein